MLHDPSHYTLMVLAREITVSDHDRSVLRELADTKAQIAALTCQRDTAHLWELLNDLKPKRPMV